MSWQASSAGGAEAKIRRKRVPRAEIAANDWSLTPGRGVAPEAEDEGFDFAEALRTIHAELDDLNDEAITLAATIRKNLEGWGYERSVQDTRGDTRADVQVDVVVSGGFSTPAYLPGMLPNP